MPESVHRRSADRPEATAFPAWQAADGALFVVEYADEGHFFWNGTRMRFGRDDDACQIPVWEEVNRRALSKVAGELWCSEGQMWVRNLSAVHELVVSGTKATHVLPARIRNDPGHACSAPVPRCTVTAPSTGTWSIAIRPIETSPSGGPTIQVENIPEPHRDAAEALCAPMLAGRSGVATYSEIAARTGWSERVARRRVEKLCDHYEAQIGALPGGRLPDETVAEAVARILVARNKFAVPRLPDHVRNESSDGHD